MASHLFPKPEQTPCHTESRAWSLQPRTSNATQTPWIHFFYYYHSAADTGTCIHWLTPPTFVTQEAEAGLNWELRPHQVSNTDQTKPITCTSLLPSKVWTSRMPRLSSYPSNKPEESCHPFSLALCPHTHTFTFTISKFLWLYLQMAFRNHSFFTTSSATAYLAYFPSLLTSLAISWSPQDLFFVCLF